MGNEVKKDPSVFCGLRKRVLRPLWKLRDVLFPRKYRPERYWESRHKKHGFSCRGVGNWTRSDEENNERYIKDRAVFLGFCAKMGVEFEGRRILDVGCGTGFYAEAMCERGATDYLGVDITDELFQGLKEKFPGFRFQKLDIARKKLTGEFDIIIMISVTQHIVDDKRFSFAMQNICEHLSERGVFIVTMWETDTYAQSSPHVVGRPSGYLEREFDGYDVSAPDPFGANKIYAIRRKRN